MTFAIADRPSVSGALHFNNQSPTDKRSLRLAEDQLSLEFEDFNKVGNLIEGVVSSLKGHTTSLTGLSREERLARIRGR